jgi:hypothetical protein
VASGCAAERASTPSAVLPPDAPFKTESFKRAGMRVAVPRASVVVKRRSPALFRATVADWYVSGFAYRRKEQLPRSRRQLRAARRRLVAEVRRRDPRFKLVSARLTRSHGSPAVQVTGDQVLDRRSLRTRSLHVYKGRGEYVLEMAAPVSEFGSLRGLFDRVASSLTVTGRPR